MNIVDKINSTIVIFKTKQIFYEPTKIFFGSQEMCELDNYIENDILDFKRINKQKQKNTFMGLEIYSLAAQSGILIK